MALREVKVNSNGKQMQFGDFTEVSVSDGVIWIRKKMKFRLRLQFRIV